MPDDTRQFHARTSLGRMVAADTLEACRGYIREHPDLFPPGVRVLSRGPSVGDPTVETTSRSPRRLSSAP